LPSYGISGIALDIGDYRAHGKDERVPIDSYYQGLLFYERLVKQLSDHQRCDTFRRTTATGSDHLGIYLIEHVCGCTSQNLLQTADVK
jgi:hypothetical protein